MNDRTLKQFLNILFDENEFVWFGNIYSAYKFSCKQSDLDKFDPNQPTKDGYFIGINPADEINAKHGKDAVHIYRNLLFECDNMSVEKQKLFFDRSGLPYSTMVYSGGKSLHVVVSLEEPLKSERDYRTLHEQITFALSEMTDSQTNKPTIFTRLPGFKRETKFGVRTQAVVDLKKRISMKELKQFLQPHLKEYNFKTAVKNYVKGKHTSHVTNHSEETHRKSSNILSQYVSANDSKFSSAGQYQLQCPLCEAEGKDSDMNHLSVNLEQGLWPSSP